MVVRQRETLVVTVVGSGAECRYAEMQTETNNLHRRLMMENTTRLVIDLEQLDYAGSELIGALIGMAREVTNRGGRVALSSASPETQRVLRNMKLFDLWPHFATREEALQFVAQSGG